MNIQLFKIIINLKKFKIIYKMGIYNIIYCCIPYLRKFKKIPKNLNYNDLDRFYPNIQKGRVIKVYDGDTITVASRVPKLKTNKIYKFNIRLNRIDTPEIRTNNNMEKEYGIRIRDLLSEKIMNKMVNIKVIKTDKYGRILAEISYKKDNISDWLLNNQYAIYYDGKAKISFDTRNYNSKLETEILNGMNIEYINDLATITDNFQILQNKNLGEFVIE